MAFFAERPLQQIGHAALVFDHQNLHLTRSYQSANNCIRRASLIPRSPRVKMHQPGQILAMLPAPNFQIRPRGEL